MARSKLATEGSVQDTGQVTTLPIDSSYAALLGRLRLAAQERMDGLCGGNFGRDPTPKCVRQEDLALVEKEFHVRLADPIIAYMAAGVSAWGDGPLSIQGIRERTLGVVERQSDSEYTAPEPFVVIDDDSNGNYIAVRKSDDGDSVCFLDHETSFELAGALSLREHITYLLKDSELKGSPEPFLVELYSEPDPAPVVVRVSHKKFGEGTVLEHLDGNVTIRFDAEDVGEKRLKDSFLTFL